VKCRACGTEIADKAIVCFRCGTPTDLPAAPSRPAAGRRRSLVTPGVLLLIAVIALGLWLLPPALTEGASTMYLGWAGFGLAAVVVWWLWRRR
jgi:hypothetical protein